jgi:hypothetical protein
MSGNARPAGDGDTFLEAFAAEVTGAAYPIAPSPGLRTSSTSSSTES